MAIEALLQDVNSNLLKLIGLLSADKQQPQEQATDPFIAGAGAEPAVAKQVDAAIEAADAAVAPAPAKRGRGRPAKTEAAPVKEEKPAAPVTPVVDPFAVGETEVVPQHKTRTINEVRAALVIYQTQNDQPKALKLMKDVTGAETLAQLKEADYGKLFDAAIPAGQISIHDVRAVLVAANERVANSGLNVLKQLGASNIQELKEAKFVDAVIAAHSVR